MVHLPPEPSKLLGYWMEWEKGDVSPGRVMANLKTAGLRDILEDLVAAQAQLTGSAMAGTDGGTGGAEPDGGPERGQGG
ncbi:MAG: hypothetical protein ACYDH5_06430 [Acidimicrobiales bacterium]